MAEMREFALWFLTEIPDFLLSPPISAFVGVILLFVIIKVMTSIIKIN
ncbi:MAG: hypothetical protein IKJ82_03880 [Oscillospiraceae bacterium]|nr:hypothetical protein [Oscillospiraceae bacterium]